MIILMKVIVIIIVINVCYNPAIKPLEMAIITDYRGHC